MEDTDEQEESITDSDINHSHVTVEDSVIKNGNLKVDDDRIETDGEEEETLSTALERSKNDSNTNHQSQYVVLLIILYFNGRGCLNLSTGGQLK